VKKVALGLIWIYGEQSDTGTDMGFVVNKGALEHMGFVVNKVALGQIWDLWRKK
jgi:hypothetical protein